MKKNITTVSLRKFSSSEINREIVRRKKVLANLEIKRKRLLARLDRLNKKIGRIGGK